MLYFIRTLFAFLFLVISISAFCQKNIPVEEAIVNGDFEKGNTGFEMGEKSSFYTYLVPPELSIPGKYYVDDNDTVISGKSTSTFNTAFTGIYDHTAPPLHGKMLMIDQPPGAEISWHTTVKVHPNQVYSFSAWARELDDFAINAILQFELVRTSGEVVSLGQGFVASSVWKQVISTWNSGEDTVVTLRLKDLSESTDRGNDYALDDIHFINDGGAVASVQDKIMSDDLLTLFPNPAKDRLSISTSEIQVFKVEIINESGTLIKTFTNALSVQPQFPIDDLRSGLYFLKVYSAGGTITKRFEKN